MYRSNRREMGLYAFGVSLVVLSAALIIDIINERLNAVAEISPHLISAASQGVPLFQ